jgi:hypothetical protein
MTLRAMAFAKSLSPGAHSRELLAPAMLALQLRQVDTGTDAGERLPIASNG